MYNYYYDCFFFFFFSANLIILHCFYPKDYTIKNNKKKTVNDLINEPHKIISGQKNKVLSFNMMYSILS